MSAPSLPPARRQFARRLRELRVIRGFKTARSLAVALAIDENRYTRYERAEVEPDIGLIQRICETLGSSPNDLFGAGHETPARAQPTTRPGFAETGGGYSALSDTDSPEGRGRAAWMLACAVAELQSKTGGGEPGTRQQPLARLQQTARLFTELERRPYAAVSEILLLPAVTGASAEEAQHIGKLVEELTQQST